MKNRKILCFLLLAAMVFSSVSVRASDFSMQSDAAISTQDQDEDAVGGEYDTDSTVSDLQKTESNSGDSESIDETETVIESSESVMETESKTNSTESETDSIGTELDSVESETDSTESETDSSESEIDSTESVTETDSTTETDTESDISSDETELDTEETEVAADAILSVSGDGSSVNSFIKDNIHYLFLPRSVDLSSVTVSSNQGISKINGESVTDSESETGVMSATVSIPVSTQFQIEFYDGSSLTAVFMQSTLPSISIDLTGTDIDTIKAGSKDTKYSGNNVVITDPEGGYYLSASDVEVKGRGNSSWNNYEKKGYQIKFSKKQSLFGMDKAKKWILLANSSDPSMVKNAVGFTLASNLGLSNTPQYTYADLWFDGNYQGTYMVTEKIEIGDGRVELGDSGILVEHDDAFYEEEDAWFTDYYGVHFTLKDPDLTDVGTRFDEFKQDLYSVEGLIATRVSSYWQSITEKLDVDSVARVMLINDYLMNCEAASSSQFYYQNGKGEIIHAGPVWDFDSSAIENYINNGLDYYQSKSPLYNGLCMFEEYRSIYKNIYNTYQSAFASCSLVALETGNRISSSAAMNYIRWDVLGTKDVKQTYFQDTYEKNVNSYVSWLSNRNGVFSVSKSCLDSGNYPIYRLFNTRTGEHLFTKDENEKNVLSAGTDGWKYEIIAWYVVESSNTPVYRLFNRVTGEHLYTGDANEKNVLSASFEWNYEGIAWYSDDSKGQIIYRLFDPRGNGVSSHLYTADENEKNVLSSAARGWNYEGIAWYGAAV